MRTCKCGNTARKVEYQTFSYFYCDSCRDEVVALPAQGSGLGSMIGEAAKDSLDRGITMLPLGTLVWHFTARYLGLIPVTTWIPANNYPEALDYYKNNHIRAHDPPSKVVVTHPDGSSDTITV